jgi:acyl-CoA thioesterase
MMDADTASAALGIELTELAEGRAVCRMTVTGQMINGHGLCHGGYVFLLADTAFACACNTRGPVTVAAGFRGRSRELRRVTDSHQDN